MPSNLHEALAEMFRLRPLLAPELLTDALGVELPVFERARVESAELTDVSPTEFRADTVVVLTAADGTAVEAVVVEVQLRRDHRKRRSWPAYVATLHARLGCPTVLLVVCVDSATAAWCAARIDLGHTRLVLDPLVLGPQRVPVVADLERAGRVPELAVLSAMAHGPDPACSPVLDALPAALSAVDPDRGRLYYDIVLDALPEAARRHLEDLVTAQAYEWKSDFARRHIAQGRAEGEARGRAAAVLAVLEARGVEVPGEARARVASCTDLDQLDAWVRRAATVDSVRDLLT
ncbi:MAG: hypothetical protein M3291_14080 [Actinomycetota bacterium]|nr:hypothetical protein [Actinomycetota bacterium]